MHCARRSKKAVCFRGDNMAANKLTLRQKIVIGIMVFPWTPFVLAAIHGLMHVFGIQHGH